MNSDGSGQTPLQTTPLNEEQPNWSPDGTKLVFDAQAGGSSVNPSDLYSINPDGTGLTNLTNSTAREFEAAWSPDGTQIVYQGYQEFSGR